MKAANFVPHVFGSSVSGVEAGLHGELAAQSPEECLTAAMYVAAEAPFQGFIVRRLGSIQCVAEAIPQVRLAQGLERLNIVTTPWAIMKPDGTPFAIVDEEKRMRLTRNLSEKERMAVLSYDFHQMDESRSKRVSFYLEKYGLSSDLNLPVLTQEESQCLEGKCMKDLALPMLLYGGEQLPIFDNADTVTIVTGDREHMNPEIYDSGLGSGVLLPLSEAFVARLNDGTIHNFTFCVNPAGDSALEITVTFTVDGETITHSVVRKTARYDGGAFVTCSFGSYGAMLFSNDVTLTVSPAEQTAAPFFGGSTWRVTRVRGGVRYVSVRQDSTPLGVVPLPEKERKVRFDSVTLGFDLGDTSFCGILYHTSGKPIPIQFDAAKDILPLIEASPADRDALCNGSWFPVSYSGTARSISQLFRSADGKLFDEPSPYMVARPFIDQASGFSIARTIDNGLYAGFKSRGMIRSQADAEQAAAYEGSTAAILLIGLHQAFQHTDNVKLRLSHPNNPAYKATFMTHIKRVLDLVQTSLTDANGNGFVFSQVEYIDEATCNIAGTYKLGINGILGAAFENNLGCDMGGATTDVSVCTFTKRRILLPAIPLAGRVVTLSSLIQIARANGLVNTFRDVPEGMKTVIEQQINPIIQERLNQGLETRVALAQMVHDPDLMEAMQTLLDYFTLKLNGGKSQLLQSLVCFKNLIVEDIILRQASRIFTERDLEAGNLHLLQLGNGSRSISLICDDSSRYHDSRGILEQVLQKRTVHHLGEKAKLSLIHNQNPKTEVSNGLSCYDADEDASIEHWQDNETAHSLRELKGKYLGEAIQRTMEMAEWLRSAVPQICGEIQPLYSGLDNGFDQLLTGLEDENLCRVALCDTLTHEDGRFGSIYQMSASMAVDVWAGLALMDHVNRTLAEAQAAHVKKDRVVDR